MNKFYLPLQNKKSVLKLIKNVSRSYSLVTSCLEEPLDIFIAISYLICRLADCVEDCYKSFDWKVLRFQDIKNLMENPLLIQDISSQWQQHEWKGLNETHKNLINSENNLLIWQTYERIPRDYKLIIRYWVNTMLNGMESSLNIQDSPTFDDFNGVKVLATEEDYNLYCYFVAGTVGNIGTEMAGLNYSLSTTELTKMRKKSELCGISLQKINILEGFLDDILQSKMCYFPMTWLKEANELPLNFSGAPKEWIEKIIKDISFDLYSFLDYVVAIPYHATGYRLATLICFLVGCQKLLNTKDYYSDLFTINHRIEVSDSQLFQCFESAKEMVDDNNKIVDYVSSIKIFDF